MKPKRKAAPIRCTKWVIRTVPTCHYLNGVDIDKHMIGKLIRVRLEYQEIRSDRGQKK